jgi:hypothetical protein
MGAFELQIFVSLMVVLGAAFVALICDYLKGNNEQLRETNIELRVRNDEREKWWMFRRTPLRDVETATASVPSGLAMPESAQSTPVEEMEGRQSPGPQRYAVLLVAQPQAAHSLDPRIFLRPAATRPEATLQLTPAAPEPITVERILAASAPPAEPMAAEPVPTEPAIADTLELQPPAAVQPPVEPAKEPAFEIEPELPAEPDFAEPRVFGRENHEDLVPQELVDLLNYAQAHPISSVPSVSQPPLEPVPSIPEPTLGLPPLAHVLGRAGELPEVEMPAGEPPYAPPVAIPWEPRVQDFFTVFRFTVVEAVQPSNSPALPSSASVVPTVEDLAWEADALPLPPLAAFAGQMLPVLGPDIAWLQAWKPDLSLSAGLRTELPTDQAWESAQESLPVGESPLPRTEALRAVPAQPEWHLEASSLPVAELPSHFQCELLWEADPLQLHLASNALPPSDVGCGVAAPSQIESGLEPLLPSAVAAVVPPAGLIWEGTPLNDPFVPVHGPALIVRIPAFEPVAMSTAAAIPTVALEPLREAWLEAPVEVTAEPEPVADAVRIRVLTEDMVLPVGETEPSVHFDIPQAEDDVFTPPPVAPTAPLAEISPVVHARSGAAPLEPSFSAIEPAPQEPEYLFDEPDIEPRGIVLEMPAHSGPKLLEGHVEEPVQEPEAEETPVSLELQVPAGVFQAGVLDSLMVRPEPFTGLVLAISILDRTVMGPQVAAEALTELNRSIEEMMLGSLREHDTLCRVSDDEFVILYPRMTGAAAQRQTAGMSERLWDFQLRSLGYYMVIFSLGSSAVEGQPLSAAVENAREQMEQAARARRGAGAVFLASGRRAVNA